jgi:hypothetical protein
MIVLTKNRMVLPAGPVVRSCYVMKAELATGLLVAFKVVVKELVELPGGRKDNGQSRQLRDRTFYA